jgi:hypothetical protein
MMFRRLLAGAAVIYLSWLGMQAVHELGHVLAAWSTGGSIVRVVLHPLAISRTDVAPNPSPLAVAWAGPIVGVAVPLLMMVIVRCVRGNSQVRDYVEFFAGFCLIANGVYIGIGSIDGVGDAGDLLRHGAPRWQLVAFGVAAAAAGLWLWHRALAARRVNHARQPSSVADP